MTFQAGDLITGIDRSYERSIYRFVRELPEAEHVHKEGNRLEIEVEIVSFSGYVFKKGEASPDTTKHQATSYFRLATPKEIEESRSGPIEWHERKTWLESINPKT